MIRAKAFIFDIDQTLLNTLKRFCVVFNRNLEKLGLKPLEYKDFVKKYSLDILDEVIALPKSKGRQTKLHRFWLSFLREFRSFRTSEDHLIPGVKKILEKIYQAKIPIAANTNCIAPVSQVREELIEFGIGEYVSVISTGYEAKDELANSHHFSKKTIIKKAIAKLKIPAKDCVVIGDYYNDIRAGKALGAKTIAVLTGLTGREYALKLKPDAVIDSLAHLFDVIEIKE
jgi:phosphoglycolate phosphatase-like HAD superfamily hydrolase